MVKQSLVDFIISQKKLGESDVSIRSDLLEKGWPSKTLDEAFAKVEPEKHKPVIFKILSLFSFLISLSYLYKTIAFLFIVIITSTALNSAGGFYPFLKVFPTLFPISFITAFAALIYIYIGIKLPNGSRSIRDLSLITLILVPLIFNPFLYFLATPLINVDSAVKNHGPVFFALLDPFLILNIVALGILFLSYHRFEYLDHKLSNITKIVLGIISTLLFSAISLVMVGNLIAGFNTDLDYTKTQSAVNYHLYRPDLRSQNFVQVAKFAHIDSLAGIPSAVQSAYDIPFEQAIKGDPSEIIIMRQVKVPDSFKLDEFAANYVINAPAPEKIDLSNALNQTGYLISQQNKIVLNTVIFLTPDHILISLMTPKVPSDRLIQFAGSIK